MRRDAKPESLVRDTGATYIRAVGRSGRIRYCRMRYGRRANRRGGKVQSTVTRLAYAVCIVTIEPDGRVWVVAPSNGYAGYAATFPKGRVEKGLPRRVIAIREAYEESGLKVEITGFLADSSRSLTYTRYYLARRIDGTPADMGGNLRLCIWCQSRNSTRC
ncbi:NUDIX hydrolase [Burkholderia vietnamiensis]|uniref:NUDIX hydrolase n=1 Tax=Burkholderia vietnamiensis TaxID=60552 RepID=UPI0009C16127